MQEWEEDTTILTWKSPMKGTTNSINHQHKCSIGK